MTVRERGLREARRVAREVTKRWGIKRAEDIRIEAIAKAEGLRIVEVRCVAHVDDCHRDRSR